MTDFLRPTSQGNLSEIAYKESDCQRMSTRLLSLNRYKQKMARGEPTVTYTYSDTIIEYLYPGEIGHHNLSFICDYVNLN